MVLKVFFNPDDSAVVGSVLIVSCGVDSVVAVTSVVSIVVCGTVLAVFVDAPPVVVDVSGTVLGTIVIIEAVDTAVVGSVVILACVVGKVVGNNSVAGVIIVVDTIEGIVDGLFSVFIASVVMV